MNHWLIDLPAPEARPMFEHGAGLTLFVILGCWRDHYSVASWAFPPCAPWDHDGAVAVGACRRVRCDQVSVFHGASLLLD